jgi:LemA protein
MAMRVIPVILIGVGLHVVGVCSGLVAGRNGCKNAFAQIDVQLTRRCELIPNPARTVKGCMAHERGMLEAGRLCLPDVADEVKDPLAIVAR